MDLIQAIKKVETKDRERNKLLGQKELLMEGLKDLGFKDVKEAKDVSLKLVQEVSKMNTHYGNGEAKFKKDFGHLL